MGAVTRATGCYKVNTLKYTGERVTQYLINLANIYLILEHLINIKCSFFYYDYN